LSDLDF
jgi:hypothetical protein